VEGGVFALRQLLTYFGILKSTEPEFNNLNRNNQEYSKEI